MKVWNKLLLHVACNSLIFSSLQAAVLPVGQAPVVAQEGSSPTTQQARLETLPDSPGSTRSQAQDQSSVNTAPPGTEAQPQSQAQREQPASQPQSQSSQSSSNPPQRPVGTAAAETSNASGVAASQPAGVAIAPAKQRRVRTMVLRVGALVGAGVAVGTVVALTQGTPSKPPGAR